MEKRLPNIFKTMNIMKLAKVILKSSERVLQESPCLIYRMIFEEIYFSIYVFIIVS